MEKGRNLMRYSSIERKIESSQTALHSQSRRSHFFGFFFVSASCRVEFFLSRVLFLPFFSFPHVVLVVDVWEWMMVRRTQDRERKTDTSRSNSLRIFSVVQGNMFASWVRENPVRDSRYKIHSLLLSATVGKTHAWTRFPATPATSMTLTKSYTAQRLWPSG